MHLLQWRTSHARVDGSPFLEAAWWADLEIRQVGRGVMVRVRAPRFTWWNDRQTWDGDPIGSVYDWLEEERGT